MPKYYEEPSIGGWHNLGMTDPCHKFPLAGGRRACTQRKDPLLAAMLDTRQGPTVVIWQLQRFREMGMTNRRILNLLTLRPAQPACCSMLQLVVLAL